MTVTVKKGVAKGSIFAPPSKSDTHRKIIAAALSKGVSTIENFGLSEDIKSTLEAITKLGAKYFISENTLKIESDGIFIKENEVIDCNESGSTLRFLIPVFLTSGKKVTFTGTKKLFSRPLEIYEEIFSKENIFFEKTENSLTVKGRIKPDVYEIKGDISSQFISGLLFALPLLEKESKIKILPPVESENYIKMTLATLLKSGVKTRVSENEITIPGNQEFLPFNTEIEGDFSNAAIFEAFNHIGGEVKIFGLDKNSLQGDKVYKELFSLLETNSPTVDIKNCPDLSPVLITLAAIKNGAEFINTHRLSLKESDRGNAIKTELEKFGADISVFENSILVNKTKLHTPDELLYSHNDHRIVMALTLISTLFGGKIKNAEAVNKSFPDFFKAAEKLGIETEKDNL